MRNGWKVLTPNRGSAIIWKGGEGHRNYPEGELVKPAPKCGPLAVFTSEHAAYAFRRRNGMENKGLVVLCEYKPSRAKSLHLSRREEGLPLMLAPTGTAAALTVRCLE